MRYCLFIFLMLPIIYSISAKILDSTSVDAGELSYLSISETIELSRKPIKKSEKFLAFPDYWRMNPEALDQLYTLIKEEKDIDVQSYMVLNIGFIGSAGDIAELLSLLRDQEFISEEHQRKFSENTIAAISLIGMRGFKDEAQSELVRMISPEYWVNFKFEFNPYGTSNVIKEVNLYALGYFIATAPSDSEIELVINKFILLDTNYDKFAQFYTGRQEMVQNLKNGLGKLNLWNTNKSNLEIAMMLAEHGHVEKTIDYARNDDERIEILLKNPPDELHKDYVNILREKMFDLKNYEGFTKLARKTSDADLAEIRDRVRNSSSIEELKRDLVYLGHAGRTSELDFILGYVHSFSGRLLKDDELEKLAYAFYALSILKYNEDKEHRITSHHIFLSMYEEEYWKKLDFDFGFGTNLSPTGLTQEVALSYLLLMASNLSKSLSDIKNYKDIIEIITENNVQRDILLNLIDRHYLPFKKNIFIKSKINVRFDSFLEQKAYDEFNRVISGPITVERLAW